MCPSKIAEWLSTIPIFDLDLTKIEATIKKMTDEGSRYKNLESALGLGATLVLGTKYKDSTWCKTLPKKDEKFEEIVGHLRRTSLPELAARYAPLRMAVMEQQLATFREFIRR